MGLLNKKKEKKKMNRRKVFCVIMFVGVLTLLLFFLFCFFRNLINPVLIPSTEESHDKQISILETGINNACDSGLCELNPVIDAKQKLENLRHG